MQKKTLQFNMTMGISLFLLTALEALACQANLMERDGRFIVESFYEHNCAQASRQCNRRLKTLKRQYPGSYHDSYCTIADNAPRPMPPRYSGRVIRSYDRCQAPGVVRCTQEWSDGRVITEDYPCRGCRGFGNPSGDPCGWMCSFPQK